MVSVRSCQPLVDKVRYIEIINFILFLLGLSKGAAIFLLEMSGNNVCNCYVTSILVLSIFVLEVSSQFFSKCRSWSFKASFTKLEEDGDKYSGYTRNWQ